MNRRTMASIVAAGHAALWCVVAAQAAGGQERGPEATLVSTPTQRARAELTLRVTAPRLRAEEWLLFMPQAPVTGGQTEPSTRLSREARVVRDLAPRGRPVFLVRVPAANEALRTSIDLTIVFEAQLHARRLAPNPRRVAARVELADDERRFSLRATDMINHDDPAFAEWLAQRKLARGEGESDLAYARRVFLALKRGFKYHYVSTLDRQVTNVCREGRSDCGGLGALFVAACRAHDVPARLLVGRWAQSTKKGERLGDIDYQQEHVKAEFFAAGVGWVPVDVSSAVLHDPRPDGLQFFGQDAGDFFTMHVDPEVELDTVHFGRKSHPWMQSPAYWVTGAGTLDGAKYETDWRVRAP